MRKYIDRLVTAWMDYGKIIIAVDYDDTIFPYSIPDSGQYKKRINLIRNCHKAGAYIVIFTASAPSRYEEIMGYCKSNNLHVDTINANPIELPYGNNGKVFANIYLDDRAGLDESLKILESALSVYRKKADYFKQRHFKKLLDELYEECKHGEEDHQKWLKSKFTDFYERKTK